MGVARSSSLRSSSSSSAAIPEVRGVKRGVRRPALTALEHVDVDVVPRDGCALPRRVKPDDVVPDVDACARAHQGRGAATAAPDGPNDGAARRGQGGG
jgi:hypothetical protein